MPFIILTLSRVTAAPGEKAAGAQGRGGGRKRAQGMREKQVSAGHTLPGLTLPAVSMLSSSCSSAREDRAGFGHCPRGSPGLPWLCRVPPRLTQVCHGAPLDGRRLRVLLGVDCGEGGKVALSTLGTPPAAPPNRWGDPRGGRCPPPPPNTHPSWAGSPPPRWAQVRARPCPWSGPPAPPRGAHAWICCRGWRVCHGRETPPVTTDPRG